MERMRIIFLGLAVLFINVHALIPHTHDSIDQVSAQTIIQLDQDIEDDFFGLLKQVFHQDLGKDHLENFQNQDFDIKIIPPLFCEGISVKIKLIKIEEVEHQESYLETYQEVPYISSNQLRGPPFLS